MFDFDPIDYCNLKVISMNYKHNFLSPIQEGKGFFREELLINNVYDTYDAILKGYRCASTRTEKYYRGEYIKIIKKNHNKCIIALVTKSSYPVKSIPKDEWSRLEGWTIEYFDTNPKIIDKYQFKYKFIKEIDYERIQST